MSKPEELMQTLSEALALLQEHAGRPDPRAYAPAPPLPSLLEQCAAMVAAQPGPQPYRVLHHMACTGGTLISRCLATMPNVVLLSEIDPLSAIPLPKRGHGCHGVGALGFAHRDKGQGFRRPARGQGCGANAFLHCLHPCF